jgi:Ca2+-binding RTX toxin-like protein
VNGNVRVNDEAPDGGRVRCSNVRSILVRAGDGPDRVVLSDLGRTAFDVLLEIGVFGESGNDTLIGSHLGDHLFGGAGADVLRGGDGLDRLVPGGGGGELVGGEGKDQAVFAGGGEWVVNDGRVRHRATSEQTTLQGVEIVSITGGAGNDAVTGIGFSGAMVVRTGGGDDELRSGSGRDHLVGGPGDDVLSGGDGNDRLEGQDGNDELRGGDDDDMLLGGPGRDVCVGGEGADSLQSC